MKDGLYHRDVWMPFNLGYASMIRYSQHAREATRDDRFGAFELPRVISTQTAEVIEVEVRNGKFFKALFRVSHDEYRDVCVVVLLDQSLVKTAWINLRTDDHKTLDSSKYIQG
jgi:hypothetical protein